MHSLDLPSLEMHSDSVFNYTVSHSVDGVYSAVYWLQRTRGFCLLFLAHRKVGFAGHIFSSRHRHLFFSLVPISDPPHSHSAFLFPVLVLYPLPLSVSLSICLFFLP